MALAKRIIPCLDVQAGRVVKGINFVELRDAGDPALLADFYCQAGADELVLLNINAAGEDRRAMMQAVSAVAASTTLPLTVGGGVKSLGDFHDYLFSGADKVAVNSASVRNPELISHAAAEFGSQCVIAAVDVRRRTSGDSRFYEVMIGGGKVSTGLDALKWCATLAELGAGELLLTSIDQDGTKGGYDVELTGAVGRATGLPLIASGGAGGMGDFLSVFREGNADAALAASIFHYGEIEIAALKRYLHDRGVTMRL